VGGIVAWAYLGGIYGFKPPSEFSTVKKPITIVKRGQIQCKLPKSKHPKLFSGHTPGLGRENRLKVNR